MSSITEKIRGAVNLVHGLGENIRGTLLGAVDSATHSGETKNDEVARKGRQEIEEGWAMLTGRPRPAENLNRDAAPRPDSRQGQEQGGATTSAHGYGATTWAGSQPQTTGYDPSVGGGGLSKRG